MKSDSIKNGQPPCSAFLRTQGLVYFTRMVDKIRLLEKGDLREDYIPNLGIGFDSRCCNFLGVEYAALSARVLEGGSDNEVFDWCRSVGSNPNDEQILVWTKFMLKRGWRDEDDGSTQELDEYKAGSGLGHRSDIVTFFDYYEVDEGRAE